MTGHKGKDCGNVKEKIVKQLNNWTYEYKEKDKLEIVAQEVRHKVEKSHGLELVN